jgi:hypothetical protein
MGGAVSELQKLIVDAYEHAKRGDWDRVLSEWREVPLLARRCSRYQREPSGWTFLHQAAYFGNEAACRELIRLGASVGQLSLKGKTAEDISREKGHLAVASVLRRALLDRESLWKTAVDPDLRPSSNLWHEAVECQASEALLILYAGGIFKIPNGARHFVDSFGRILIGWHGTYDPPCGMDGESMI